MALARAFTGIACQVPKDIFRVSWFLTRLCLQRVFSAPNLYIVTVLG